MQHSYIHNIYASSWKIPHAYLPTLRRSIAYVHQGVLLYQLWVVASNSGFHFYF